MTDWREDPDLVLSLIMCYPHWRTIIRNQEDGVEKCLEMLLNNHSFNEIVN